MRGTLLTIFIMWAYSVSADTWPSPVAEKYFSENKQFFIEIIPCHIPEKYTRYLAAKSENRNLKKYTAKDTVITPCTGTLYRIENMDTIQIWTRQLINRVSPMVAGVSDDGKFVFTLDNWATLGYGPEVFVVYNSAGDLLKRYGLDDFTPFPLNSYQRSISSIWWRCGVKFNESETNIEICFVDKDKNKLYRHYNLTELKFED